jgi:hypothetical protein
MRMKSKIIILLLCITMILSFNAMIVDARLTLGNQCDLSVVENGMNKIMGDINANSQYTDFIANSSYKVVKLTIDKKNDYYFMYNKDTKKVEQSSSAIQEDFTIKVTCKQMTKVVKDYNSESPKFNRAILNRIPMKVKSNILNECFETPWCVNRLLGK